MISGAFGLGAGRRQVQLVTLTTMVVVVGEGSLRNIMVVTGSAAGGRSSDAPREAAWLKQRRDIEYLCWM